MARTSCLLFGLAATLHAQPAGADLPVRKVADMFKPLSRPAEMIHDVSLIVLLICAVIFLIVTGMLVFVVWKFRRPKNDDGKEPPQIYGSTNIELAWTVIPLLITVLLILVTSRTIGEIQNMKMPADALNVRVVGHQWWWEIHYEGDYKGKPLGIITANELHIPVSSRDASKATPTHLTLQSADVIHSFWVAQLAGKTDVVPNRSNEMWLDPYETGIYFGNCAEYCGTQHANMLLKVVVQSPEDFQKWVDNQKAPVATNLTPDQTQGRSLFFANSCVNCHMVNGTVSQGVFGPDLTKLMTRMTIGAGVAPLNEQTLTQWVTDPQSLKSGCLMPDMQLGKEDVKKIVDYLMTLK